MQSLLHAVTLMHCKTRQGNGSKMIIVAGATNINLKKLKTMIIRKIFETNPSFHVKRLCKTFIFCFSRAFC